jgi:UrcA family protein
MPPLPRCPKIRPYRDSGISNEEATLMATGTAFGTFTIGAAAWVLALTATASPAAAETLEAPHVSTRSVIVRYERDALNHDGGRQALNARIETAARAVCGRMDIKDFHARRLWKQCVEAAASEALQQLDEQPVAMSRH